VGHVLGLEGAHVVVVEEAETRRRHPRAVDALDGLGQSHDVARGIHAREVGRLATSIGSPSHAPRDGLGVLGAEHPLLGNLSVEVRVEGSVAPIPEGAPDRLGERNGTPGGVRLPELRWQLLVDVEHLEERAAGGRGGEGEDAQSFEARRDRPPLDGPGNLGQVVPADQAAVAHHVVVDHPGDLAGVEVLHALLGDARQGVREHRLREAGPDRVRCLPVAEKERGGATAEQLLELSPGEGVLKGAHPVASPRQSDRGLEDPGQRQAPVVLQRVAQRGRSARNRGRAIAAHALGAGEGLLGGPVRSARRAVESHRLPLLGEVQEQHRLSTEPGARRLADAEGEGRGDCRVHRVPAVGQHLDPGLGRPVVGGGDDPLARHGEPLRMDGTPCPRLDQLGVDAVRHQGLLASRRGGPGGLLRDGAPTGLDALLPRLRHRHSRASSEPGPPIGWSGVSPARTRAKRAAIGPITS